jgi:hypothetical protein
MEVPEFFELLYPDLPSGTCLRLLKSLYGLKQAPRVWLEEVATFLKGIGFKTSVADPNLFIRGDVFILVYVDDMAIIGPRKEVNEAKAEIAKRWKCKDLGPASTFVGYQIERDRSARTLTIHQTNYLIKLLERFRLNKANPTQLPLPSGTVLEGPSEIRELVDGKYQPLVPIEVALYRQIVGSLIYLSNGTRPDISYAVGQLARHMQDPRITHLRLAKQTLRYLNGTRNWGIRYGLTNSDDFDQYSFYSDATWGSESDRISIQGSIVKRAGGAISWTSQRQKSTALSSMEAEFMAASEAAKQAAWLEKLNIDLGEMSKDPPTLWCDNQPAVDLIYDPKHHNKAKHVDIRYMFIRNDMVAQNRLKVEHIPGKDQPADILTKQLPVDQFKRLRLALGMHEFRAQG